jgi:type II secretory pathway pseudopilin PulG
LVGPRPHRRSAGFTLVELTIALVAGLIVAMGIVGLSRAATTTFHEEVRNAAAEAALRTAIDRLRADLQRAGYMSTPNIMSDPKVARSPTALTNVDTIDKSMSGLRRLSSVYLADGGSLSRNGIALSKSQSTALAPDLLEIGGNMTTTEQFEVQSIQPASGSCQRIYLNPISAAMFRVNAVGTTAAPDELRNMFQPVPKGLTTQFIVRIVDDQGRTQYVATCPESTPPVAGFDTFGSAATPYPYVDIDSVDTPLQTASSTQTVSSLQGTAAGKAWINPVQIVRWEITQAGAKGDPEPAQYVNALDNQALSPGTADPNKYDLMRSYVDATGALVPQTSEIVAEYAVDLDFAFTVDSGTSQAPVLQTFAFDDATSSAAWAYDVSGQPVSSIGPQRIRSIRVRLVTRTAQPDRTANVPVTSPGTTGVNESFLYRYCVVPSCATSDGTPRLARARTITAEVWLQNLARSY